MRLERIAIALAVLASGASVFAQERPEARRQERKERREAQRESRRDEMFKMVDAYLAMNIEEKLGLSAEQFARVLPLVRRASVDRRRFTERRMEILRGLRERLESGAATEAQVGQALHDLKALEDEEPATLRKDRDAVDQLLTVVQQAKLRVLELEVERRIRGLMQLRAGGPAAGGQTGSPNVPND